MYPSQNLITSSVYSTLAHSYFCIVTFDWLNIRRKEIRNTTMTADCWRWLQLRGGPSGLLSAGSDLIGAA